VAGLLHDYDPRREPYVAPKVVNTIHHLHQDEEINNMLKEINVDINRVIMLIRNTDFPLQEEQKQAVEKALQLIENDDLRELTGEQVRLLALADKSAVYLILEPKESGLRVRELAKEIGLEENVMLLGTPDFFNDFVERDIQDLLPVLPNEYGQRWEEIKQYFRDIAGYIASRQEDNSVSTTNSPLEDKNFSSPVARITAASPATSHTSSPASNSQDQIRKELSFYMGDIDIVHITQLKSSQKIYSVHKPGDRKAFINYESEEAALKKADEIASSYPKVIIELLKAVVSKVAKGEELKTGMMTKEGAFVYRKSD